MSNTGTSHPAVRYCIDHADHIVSVNDEWLDFARANGAETLTLDNLKDREIWRFISDPDTRVIYRLLFDAVRTKSRPLRVTFRCDSPTRRRYMELECSPAPRLGLDICSRLLREETRPYISVLDSGIGHSEKVVKLCAWCKQAQIADDDWRDIEHAIHHIGAFDANRPPMVTHGMCPDCHLAKLREIRAGLHESPLDNTIPPAS